MKLFDTHTHLDAAQFAEDCDVVIQRAIQEGVGWMINVGFNEHTIPSTMQLAEQYDFIYAAVGWHPQDAATMKQKDDDRLASLCAHEKVVAIGEIGLDYYWDTSPKEVQHRVLRNQLGLARELKMPVIIHSRESHEDLINIFREEKAAELNGVMHSFSGSWETAKVFLKMGFYLSFSGPITFKNAKQPKEVLKNTPLDQLLIETDSPYLTPHPYRGKRNEPSYIRLVAETAAQIKGIPIEQLAQVTNNNAMELFSIE